MKHAGIGGPASGTSVREDVLVARLSALAPALDGEPDPEWQARTRARMVAMAAVRTPEPAPVSPLRRVFSRAEDTRSAWRSRLTAGIAGAAAAVTGLASVVALSADAGPGDALYGLKRGTEQTQLALAGDARGRTLLAFATTRLEELGGVLEGGSSARVVEETLAMMDAQTLGGAAWLTWRAVETGSSAPLDDLSNWSAAQSSALEDLLGDVPEGARAEAASSATLLDRIDERAGDLRAVLECADGPATAGADELGPRAGDCTSPAGPPVVGGDPAVPGAGTPPTTGAPSTAPPTDGAPGSGGTEDSGGTDGSPGSGPDGETGGSTGGGTGGDPGGDPGSGTGGVPGGVPAPTAPPLPLTPSLPSLPRPALPSLVPSPDGSVRPPLGGSAAPTEGVLPGVVEDVTCTVPLISDC